MARGWSGRAVALAALLVSACARERGCAAQRAVVPPPAAVAQALLPGADVVEQERVDAAGHRVVVTTIRVDLSRVELLMRRPPRARLEGFAAVPSVAVAVNGAFFDHDESPSGWVVSEGMPIAAPTAGGGSGFFVVRDARAHLWPATLVPLRPTPEFALQCGPRLVEADGTMGIHSDDGKRAARTALCRRRDGQELAIVLAWTRNSDRDGPTLYEMAQWLRGDAASGEGFGCEAALNLDGGPSTGVYLRDHPQRSHQPFGRVPLALVLRERSVGGPSDR